MISGCWRFRYHGLLGERKRLHTSPPLGEEGRKSKASYMEVSTITAAGKGHIATTKQLDYFFFSSSTFSLPLVYSFFIKLKIERGSGGEHTGLWARRKKRPVFSRSKEGAKEGRGAKERKETRLQLLERTRGIGGGEIL